MYALYYNGLMEQNLIFLLMRHFQVSCARGNRFKKEYRNIPQNQLLFSHAPSEQHLDHWTFVAQNLI